MRRFCGLSENTMQTKRNKKEGTDIPAELLFEILLRLPARSVTRFRHVCKLWRSITLEPLFIEAHVDRACKSDHPHIVLLGSDWMGCRFYITMLDKSCNIKYRLSRPGCRSWLIRGCCNGLLCFYHEVYKTVELLNPTTGESLTIPKHTQDPGNLFTWGHSLGFEPVMKEFKVIHFYHGKFLNSSNSGMRCEVFTLGASSWRQIVKIDYMPFCNGVSVHGVIYWMAERGNSSTVLSLDLKLEKFTPIPLLDAGMSVSDVSLVELEGSLSLVLNPPPVAVPGFREEMKIWMLVEATKWSHKYTIVMPTSFPGRPWPLLVQNKKVLVQKYPVLGYCEVAFDSGGLEEVYGDEIMSTAYIHTESLIPLRTLTSSKVLS